MSLLQIGATAPDFSLLIGPGRAVRLSELRGQPVVLVFYQADWSPVCTLQLDHLNASLSRIKSHQGVALGISVDSPWSHQSFVDARQLRFSLAADFEPKGAVARSYGVYRETDGTAERALFVLDAEGQVAWSRIFPMGIEPDLAGVWEILVALQPPLALPLNDNELSVPISASDHVRGAADAKVTLVEYGDYECPHCAAVREVIAHLLAMFPHDLRFVFRNFPLTRLHPHAQFAAIAAEAAGQLGAFWTMHDTLFAHQQRLRSDDILRYAGAIALAHDEFIVEIENPIWQGRVSGDLRSGIASGVNGTPTFFINGVRYDGRHDRVSMEEAIRVALAANP